MFGRFLEREIAAVWPKRLIETKRVLIVLSNRPDREGRDSTQTVITGDHYLDRPGFTLISDQRGCSKIRFVT